MADHPQVEVRSREDLRAWLATNHTQSGSIWLVTYKAGSPHYLAYNTIVEEALAWGWIDSLPRALDAERTMHRLSPRKAGSGWSPANRARVEQLIVNGLMQPAGLAVVVAAKADGSWDTLVAAGSGEPPPDLAAALDDAARAGWDGYAPSARRRQLEWLAAAKRPATRGERIAKIAEGARNGRDPTNWRAGR